ncbi:hypothetical protein LIP_2944 [Limnochorda pilosa]|uniref:DUF2993 domain-containing protein n=1 Tax=Limnochorda pilosa TaxID=1555112 RepID=A0A0K2SNR3_LIMPI|nr:hypothetical protein LIP_2944 [Limnochorda pilosa]
MRRAARITGLVLALGLAAQVLLPPATGALLGRLLRSDLKAEGPVIVRVSSMPALELLVGRVDRLRVDARAIHLDDLAVDTLLADVSDLWVDVPSLLQGRFATGGQGEARARLVLTEEGLNQYLWTKVDPSRRFSIRLAQEGAALEGSFLGPVLPVRVEGRLLLEGPAHIRFQPERVSVREAELPQPLLRVLGEELVFPVDVEQLPVEIGLDDLTMGDGWLVATGSSEALNRKEGREGEV